MRIAIPTFRDRVSPRFDCAAAILVVDVADDGETTRREESVANWDAAQRVGGVLEWGVEVVLCGGIDCQSVQSLQSAGITVYGWVAGSIEDALGAFLRGELDESSARAGRGWGRCRRFAGGPPGTDDMPGPGRGRGCGGGGRRRGGSDGGGCGGGGRGRRRS